MAAKRKSRSRHAVHRRPGDPPGEPKYNLYIPGEGSWEIHEHSDAAAAKNVQAGFGDRDLSGAILTTKQGRDVGLLPKNTDDSTCRAQGRRGNPQKGQQIMKKHNPHYSISQWVDSEIDGHIEGELQERGLSSRDTDSMDFSHTPELKKAAERFTKEAVRVVKAWVKKNPKLAEDLKESDDLDSDDDIAWNTWANIVGHGVGFWENMTKADYASLDKAISSDKKLSTAYSKLENEILEVVNAGFEGSDDEFEENPRSRPQRHKDVEFHVEQDDFTRYYNDANEATAVAVARSISNGRPVILDVVVSSRAGAKWYGGDSAVEDYDEDPEASVHERIVIRAESQGRIA